MTASRSGRHGSRLDPDGAPRSIAADIDLEGDGKRIGNLRLKYSNDRYALGYIPIPIAVIKNGKGPTILLIAGVHGDEYEGPVILMKLIHQLDAKSLRGRLIILPALNAPALSAAARVSPLDDGNLNRAFPGDPDGGPTAMIADYVEHELLPRCDAAVDLHAGGKASYYMPCAFVYRNQKEEINEANRAMANIFDAPFALLVEKISNHRSLNAAASRQEIPMIAVELGGGGAISRGPLAIGERGVRKILEHLGALMPKLENEQGNSNGNSNGAGPRWVAIRGEPCYVHATSRGIFEPCFDSGDSVRQGQVAGYLHHVEEPERSPTCLLFETDGVVIARGERGLVERGEMLATLAVDIS